MFILTKDMKPYFDEHGKIHPCTIGAENTHVDFKEEVKLDSIKGYYTHDEILKILDVKNDEVISTEEKTDTKKKPAKAK